MVVGPVQSQPVLSSYLKFSQKSLKSRKNSTKNAQISQRSLQLQVRLRDHVKMFRTNLPESF